MPSATTTTPRRQRNADPQILAAARLLENLAYLYPEAYEILSQRLRDALAPGGRGYRPRVSGSRGDSSVDSALVSREHIEFCMSEIIQSAINIATSVHEFNALLRDYVAPPPPERVEATDPDDRRRCDCAGQEGADEWGDATCDELPVKAGLCQRHYNSRYYWRRKNDLPIRGVEEPGDPMPDGYHTPGPPPAENASVEDVSTGNADFNLPGVLTSAAGGLGEDPGGWTP